MFKIVKSIIKKLIAAFDGIYNYFALKYKCVKYGENLTINGKISVHGSGNIAIGDNVVINSSENANPTSGFNRTHIRAEEGGTVIIQNNVGISNASITAKKSVIIMDDCFLGSGVKIWDTDFHPVSYDERMDGDRGALSMPVVIKKGAFIGACSIILKGVIVGEKSVIGAGSVVTKNVPDGEIWGGNPAVFIKKVNSEEK